MVTVMLDTNVLIRLIDRAERGGEDSCERFVRDCVSCGVELRCTALSLKDIAYIVPRSIKRRFAVHTLLEETTLRYMIDQALWGSLLKFINEFPVASVDAGAATAAMELRTQHPDFEDDLIIAAARAAGADYVATYDEDLARHFPGYAMAPNDLRSLLGAGQGGRQSGPPASLADSRMVHG